MMMQNFGMAGGASAVMAVAAAAAPPPDAFDKSPLNPVNMSRTAATTPSTHNAPSAKLLERVRVAAADLAELASVQAGWRYVTEKNGATAYEMNGSVVPSTVSVAATFGNKAGGKASDYYLVKATTTVRADPDRALALLSAATTDRLALRMNQLFGRHYQNAVLIDHMSCTSPPAQFQSEDGSMQSFTEDDAYAVNWLSLKPAGSSENARDFTFASYQDAFQRDPRGALVRLGRRAARDAAVAAAAAPVDPLASSSASVQSGARASRLLGVHALASFNFKDIPELPRHKATDRLHFRTSGFVVEETAQRGVARLSLFLSLTPVAATLRSPKKYEKWLQSLAVAAVGNLALQLQKAQQQTQQHVQAHPETPTAVKKVVWKKSDHCALCLKTFHTFRRCHHCRFCGEAVCNKCSGFVDASKVNVLEALQGRVRPPTPTSHGGPEPYAETRGCTRCIRTLMDDMTNAQYAYASGSVCATPNDARTSTTGSQSSAGRNSRLAGSFLHDPHAVHHQYAQQPPSPFVVHHYDDDDVSLSSLDSSSTDGRGYVMNVSRHMSAASDSRVAGDNAQGRTAAPAMPTNARQHSDDALTMDDLDGYGWAGGVRALPPSTTAPLPRFAKPPLDPKSSLSMSTVSTSHSYDDRASAASHETYGSHSTNNQQQPSQFKQLAMHPHVRSPEDDEFTPNASAMAIAGLSIHDDAHQKGVSDSHDHFDLHDYEADHDASSQFARSMVGMKATTANNNNAAGPSRLTSSSTASGGSGSFKFSMMSSHLSLHSEPEAEPHSDSFASNLYSRASDQQRAHHQQHQQHSYGAVPPAPPSVASSSSSSSKLFAASAGPRLHSQQHQSRPPRPQPSSTFHNDRARSSSSSSSAASLRINEDMMIPLPPTAMAALGGNISAKNDMILLAPAAPRSPKFVEFSDARRESICARPSDGSDMIPLHF